MKRSGVFEHLLDEHRLDPAATVLFNDCQCNTCGAEAVGMHAWLLADASRGERDLIELGVIRAPEQA